MISSKFLSCVFLVASVLKCTLTTYFVSTQMNLSLLSVAFRILESLLNVKFQEQELAALWAKRRCEPHLDSNLIKRKIFIQTFNAKGK